MVMKLHKTEGRRIRDIVELEEEILLFGKMFQAQRVRDFLAGARTLDLRDMVCSPVELHKFFQSMVFGGGLSHVTVGGNSRNSLISCHVVQGM